MNCDVNVWGWVGHHRVSVCVRVVCVYSTVYGIVYVHRLFDILFLSLVVITSCVTVL